MTDKHKSGPLGHDPLAWLDADNEKANERQMRQESGPQVEAGDEENAASAQQASDIEPLLSMTLPENLMISQAENLRQRWLGELAQQPRQLYVDGSGVTRIDAAGLQLLLALLRACQQQKCQLKLRHPSDKLRWAITVAGLDNDFADVLEQ